MKKSELTFMEGFTSNRTTNNPHKVFDWDKAARIIKDFLVKFPDLKAEAGLQKDWDYTGGVIFEDNSPTNEYYTFLASNWAIPTIILSWEGQEQEEIECYTLLSNSRFEYDSKWGEESLGILEIPLN